MTALDTYKAARANGEATDDACYTVREAHPEVTFEQVADLCWRVETGKPAPKWLHEDGTQTQASKDWDRGFEKSNS